MQSVARRLVRIAARDFSISNPSREIEIEIEELLN